MIATSISNRLLDQHDRNLLTRGYSAQLPRLNVQEKNLERELNRSSLSTTYRDEILGHGRYGDLTLHYGNNAHTGIHERVPLKNTFLSDYTKSASAIKPFLTPSYRNLTQSDYMAGKMIKNYSNSYQTSEDNVNFKRLDASSLPNKTHLPAFFKMKIKPIALVDNASIYEQEAINGHVNDYFVSKKYIKSEMMNVRDNFANALQLFDFLRNKRFDSKTRKLFKEHLNGINEIDVYSDYFSKFIDLLKDMMRRTDTLNNRAFDLKRMLDNFSITEKVVDCNLLDFNATAEQDRAFHSGLERSIINDKDVISEAKEFGNRVKSETQMLLNALKAISSDIVDNLLEDAKAIYTEKIDNQAYQREYIRDSNGYIKKDAKLTLSFDAWVNKANNLLDESQAASLNAQNLTMAITETIDHLSNNVSKQIMKTHEVAKDQIEADMKAQGVLATHQKDLRREHSEMSASIHDTRRKLGTCEMQNEFNLAQLTAFMPNIDIATDDARKRKIASTNVIWSCANDLRNNLNDMFRHNRVLEDTIVKVDKGLKSSHSGIDYDWRTIANPRRHAAAVQPAVDLVKQANSTFF